MIYEIPSGASRKPSIRQRSEPPLSAPPAGAGSCAPGHGPKNFQIAARASQRFRFVHGMQPCPRAKTRLLEPKWLRTLAM
mmetsp:Transcript_3921/g.3054  ORF Transcript_3921/g.3054 Transcript_3921/m.3054 type:complete len:80 (+) Transcript_3921:71-310(+)